jgi:hypothetical protein
MEFMFAFVDDKYVPKVNSANPELIKYMVETWLKKLKLSCVFSI